MLQQKWGACLLPLSLVPLLIIALRGGLQLAPMNQSAVYFSNNVFANDAAINVSWNFLHSLFNYAAATKNPYPYMPDAEAQLAVDEALRITKEAPQWIDTAAQPNIIFIIWESFTDKITHLQVGGNEVTPRFNALKKEGLYFSNLYASGDRTDKGLAAILSSYPALPKTSVLHSPGKSARLPQLASLFAGARYHTAFYYGGELEFANIRSYLSHSHYATLVDKNNFSRKYHNSKWGAHDGPVAQRFLTDIQTAKLPFFFNWLTLTSHEPFEVPQIPAFSGSSDERKFFSSHHYTDEVIGNFIDSLKQTNVWKNTLVVIVADHGHPLPETSKRINNFKIPMLWLGGALKEKGKVWSDVCSQLDIAPTLCQQLGLPLPFHFGRPIGQKTPSAFFTFNEGFGWVQPKGYFIWDNIGKRISEGKATPDALKQGQALQQYSFQHFLRL